MAILIFHLDDEIQMLEVYAKAFSGQLLGINTNVKSFSNAGAMEEEMAIQPAVDIFIIDVYLDERDPSGLQLTAQCRQKYPHALIFVSSAAKDAETIHASLRAGADYFISKDLEPKTVVRFIENALSKRGTSESTYQPRTCGSFMSNVGLRMPNLINSAINCLHVFGETGTGKEEVANLLEASLPKGTPLVRINCGAITPSLMVSEMFGHTRGAFTGANSDKAGLIEAANNGWIFLDEVATLPLDAQAALLRAIDNQKIRRVGSAKDISVNFRVISATNESLSQLVDSGKFRRDLWQRLKETEISIPALRDRKNEIPEFIDYFCKTMRGGPYTLAPPLRQILTDYDWRDGNIRELRNCLRAMTEKASNRVLSPNCLPDYIWPHAISSRPELYGHFRPNEALDDASLVVTWQGQTRPDYEHLCATLLFQLIKSDFKKHGKRSMRALAKSCGVPKSSMPAKIQSLIDLNIAKKSDMNAMVNFKLDEDS